MAFSEIIGQKRVSSILSKAIGNKRIPHAMLFHGPIGTGKTAMAIALAKSMLCQKDELYCNACPDCKRIEQLSHPDLILIFPSPKEPKVDEVKNIRSSITENPYFRMEIWAKPQILIDAIRKLKKTIGMTSFENKGRVIILLDAHRMTIEASNSLLKILEEPPNNVTMILVTDKSNMLLPTIESRCQQVRFDPLDWQEIADALIERKNIDQEKANLVARMSFGSYRRALELLEENVQEKQEIMLEILRKIIMNDLELVLLAESIVARFDLKTIKEILVMVSIWFRDAMVVDALKHDPEYKEKIINSEFLDTLLKFVASFEKIDYDLVIQKIEHAVELIDRNVFLNLILLQLLYELKKLLRRKKNV